MSWAEYFRCDAGHIGLHPPPIIFTIGDKIYRVCSQECRTIVETNALSKLADRKEEQEK